MLLPFDKVDSGLKRRSACKKDGVCFFQRIFQIAARAVQLCNRLQPFVFLLLKDSLTDLNVFDIFQMTGNSKSTRSKISGLSMTALNGVILYTHVRVLRALMGINDSDTVSSGASSHNQKQEGCKFAVTFPIISTFYLINLLISVKCRLISS